MKAGGMTMIEKILAEHAGRKKVSPGEILDVKVDVRLARDFGGANVVKNMGEYHLVPDDPTKSYFTFDCNPGGSDQKYAANQQICRMYAREYNIPVYDINSGIGTHLAIDKGLAVPGSTLVSTDSHANILGAIGAFGQGMGDRDIAAAWSRGSVWFKVPETIKISVKGIRPSAVYAKDIVLNLLKRFGANSLLGYAIEMEGEEMDNLTLDERITLSSMATEMGAIAILIRPSHEIEDYCSAQSGRSITGVDADKAARYAEIIDFDISQSFAAVSLPGSPHEVVPVSQVQGIKIDSVFIGSCTNGRMEDMRIAAEILDGKKVAPGIVLKIVPSTDDIWNQCLKEGLLKIFKAAGALVGNAGCAGCASGQIGQNGPGEKTVSTGNRNFAGKQGKGEVYLASPATAAASAIAGHITTADKIPEIPSVFKISQIKAGKQSTFGTHGPENERSMIIEGKVWLIFRDNIDTDMIYHNQHLSVTRLEEMGKYTFGNLEGWEDYAQRSEPGDIIVTGKNFGAGSSRQQAVDCFKSLRNQAILARSFGSIYERNAINAAFPVLIYNDLDSLELQQRDVIRIDLDKGSVINLRNYRETRIEPFSEVQKAIYLKGDLLRL